jgi:hypothetical protein
MKRISSNKSRNAIEVDILPEYNFAYRKARLNRFAERIYKDRRVVLLDPDISNVFTNSESVNMVLRAMITTMPKSAKASRKSLAK